MNRFSIEDGGLHMISRGSGIAGPGDLRVRLGSLLFSVLIVLFSIAPAQAISGDLWVQLKIEYYQDKDIYRQGHFTDVRVVEGLSTSFKGFVENKKTGHKTEYTLDSVEYHTSYPEELFTQRSLERAGH